MPIARYDACLHLLRCSRVTDYRKLEAARYLRAYWVSLQGSLRVASSVLLDFAAVIFRLTDDADERLESACTLVVSYPPDLNQGVRMEAAHYVLEHVERGSSDYDAACGLVIQLEPDSELAAELAQYLYDTSTEDVVAEAVEPGPITNIGIHADITLDNEGEATVRWGSTVDRAPPVEGGTSRPITIPENASALPADTMAIIFEQAQWDLMVDSPAWMTRYRGSCGPWQLIVGYTRGDEVSTRYYGEAWTQTHDVYHYLREDQASILYRKACAESKPVRASRYERNPVI